MTTGSQRRQGFTLIEVVLAILVLAVGALAMAGTTAYVVRQVTLGNITSKRAAALGTVVEQINATDYTSIADGVDTVAGYAFEWTVVHGQRSKDIEIVIVGPGLVNNPGSGPFLSTAIDTFDYKVVRP